MIGRRNIITILAGAALAATTLTSVGAASPNLITNGDFQPSTKGWSTLGPNSLVSIPGVGGSLSNEWDSKDQEVVAAVQCFNLTRGHDSYDFSGAIRVPSEQKRSGVAFARASLHPNLGCSGANVDDVQTLAYGEDGQWHNFNLDLDRTNGATAKSAMITLTVQKDSTNRFIFKDDAFIGHFADLSLVAKVQGGNASDGTGDVACIGFGGGCAGEDDDDAPGAGPIACEVGTDGCPGEVDEPALPDTGGPSLEPGAPVPPATPVAPSAGQDGVDGADEPAPAAAEQPSDTADSDDSPASSGGAGNTDDHDAPDNPGSPSNPTTAPSSSQELGSDAPGAAGGATATPKAPATGGKAAKSGSGANGSGQPATADSQGFATADSDAGIPLTVVLGAVFSLAAVSLLLGVALRKRRR